MGRDGVASARVSPLHRLLLNKTLKMFNINNLTIVLLEPPSVSCHACRV